MVRRLLPSFRPPRLANLERLYLVADPRVIRRPPSNSTSLQLAEKSELRLSQPNCQRANSYSTHHMAKRLRLPRLVILSFLGLASTPASKFSHLPESLCNSLSVNGLRQCGRTARRTKQRTTAFGCRGPAYVMARPTPGLSPLYLQRPVGVSCKHYAPPSKKDCCHEHCCHERCRDVPASP